MVGRITNGRLFAVAIASFGILIGSLGCTEDMPEAGVEPPPPMANLEFIPANVAPPQVDWTDAVDFHDLRQRYGRRVDFSERCGPSPKYQEASDSWRDEAYAKTVELTAPLLALCPVDPMLHLWRHIALKSLGREEEGALHKAWYLGLINSILATGDGRTKATPFVTISTHEEFAVLSYYQLQTRTQSLVEGPPLLDEIVAEAPDGKMVTIYFNPSLHFARLNAMLGGNHDS